jgi:FkbM family methyltransferase
MNVKEVKVNDSCYFYFWLDKDNNRLRGTSSTEPMQNPVEESQNLYDSLFFKKYWPSPGDVVVDAGSGPGEHIDYLSYLVGDSGMVIAIEADPKLHEQSKMLASKLGLKNVVLINAAIDKDSDSEIILYRGDHWIQSTTVPGHYNNEMIAVKTISIDDIFKKFNLNKIDYIKMNIEGAEVSALVGADANFEKVLNWCISTHDFAKIPTQKQVEALLESKGVPYEYYSGPSSERAYLGYIYSVKQKESNT